MSDRKAPGESLSRRVASRTEGQSGLHRRGMADGGEVYSGPLARKALRALGARAFTMDETIIVDDGFDPNANPEDAALYAHEAHHQAESGGSDNHGPRDAEEVAARAIERMVLHRAAAGEDLGSIMRDVRAGAAEKDSGIAAKPSTGDADEALGDAVKAYNALIAAGIPHYIIVDRMKRHVLDALSQLRQTTTQRTSKHSTF